MAGSLLVEVTPENAGTQLIGAGVKPGERVTLIVRRRSSGLLAAAEKTGASAERAGATPEDIADAAGMGDAEFERIFGRGRERA